VRLQFVHVTIEAATPSAYTCPCGWNAKHSVAYLDSLREHNLLPTNIFQRTIWQFMESVSRLREPDPDQKIAVCPNYSRHRKPDFKLRLGERITELRKYGGIGLCLQCIRLGRTHGMLGKGTPCHWYKSSLAVNAGAPYDDQDFRYRNRKFDFIKPEINATVPMTFVARTHLTRLCYHIPSICERRINFRKCSDLAT
jgi:hypothetical protein